jgi:tape measure domain-containing protein
MAARKFLAFGFTVQQANDYLATIGDTVAGLGLGAEGIDRAVLAIGQMQAKGRVMGDELLQLTELGIPALQILQKQLGLTAGQVQNIGNLAIPASIAIPALMKGMAEQFSGMSAEQAKTMQGQLSSLHDYTAQLFGTLTMPLYDALRTRWIPRASRLVNDMQAAAKAGGGINSAIAVMDKDLGAGGHIMDWWTNLRKIFGSTAIVLRRSLVPAFADAAGILNSTTYALALIAGIMGIAADHTTLLRIVLTIWISKMILARTVTIALWTWEKRKLLMDKLLYAQTWLGVRALQAQALWTGRVGHRMVIAAFAAASWRRMINFLRIAQMRQVLTSKGAAAASYAWSIATGIATAVTGGFTAAIETLTAAIYAIPIVGWILLAVAALVLLYFKWKWFHNFVNGVFRWIVHHWPLLLAILTGPFGLAALFAIKHFREIKSAALSLYHFIRGIFGKIGGLFKSVWKHIPGHGFIGGVASHIPGLASGGTAVHPGWSVVGEDGPELRYLPAGASVVPLNVNALPLPGTGGGEEGLGNIKQITIPVYIGGKKIKEIVVKELNDAAARR